MDINSRRLLRINLTNQTSSVEIIKPELVRNYIGGTGLGIKYISDEVDPHVDPLSPENKMIFSIGPLGGSKFFFSSRTAIITKSPLTNTITSSLAGGHLPAELRFCGYDMIIIEGKAEKPVYIYMVDDKVQFKSAVELWGTLVSDCQRLIKDKTGNQDTKIACIGPAGENLSYMASVISDNSKRAFGRRGVGAVMGSKNLKAICVHSANHKPYTVADKAEYNALAKEIAKRFKESPDMSEAMAKAGTIGDTDAFHEVLGFLPSRNFSTTGTDEFIETIGEQPNNDARFSNEGCYMCPTKCAQLKMAKKGSYAGLISAPEYETLFSVGLNCGNHELDAVIAADRWCDEYGIDTVSVGGVIGFAMELFEKGIITEKDTDGLKLNFGNHEAMVQLIQAIPYRIGFAGILADGVKIAAEKIGRGSEKYALHVKGMEMAAYDLRGLKGMGLSTALCYAGADHNKSYVPQEVFGIPFPYETDRLSIENKATMIAFNQDLNAAIADSGILCVFPVLMGIFDPEIYSKQLKAVTGFDYTEDEVFQIGRRIVTLARSFNVSVGFDRKDDKLPRRLMEDPMPHGASKGHHIPQADLDKMLDEYYAHVGWDNQGVPTQECMAKLGLESEYEKMMTYRNNIKK